MLVAAPAMPRKARLDKASEDFWIIHFDFLVKGYTIYEKPKCLDWLKFKLFDCVVNHQTYRAGG